MASSGTPNALRGKLCSTNYKLHKPPSRFPRRFLDPGAIKPLQTNLSINMLASRVQMPALESFAYTGCDRPPTLEVISLMLVSCRAMMSWERSVQ